MSRFLLALALLGAGGCDIADPRPPLQGSGGTSRTQAPVRCGSYLDCARGFSCDPATGSCVEDVFDSCACRELGCPEAEPCCREGYELDEELICVPDCERGGPASCYPTGRYCGTDAVCHELEATCPRAEGAPPADASGPLLFSIVQDPIGERGALCRKDPAACSNDGNVCQWSLQFYDPEGDVAGSSIPLYSALFWIRPGGSRSATYDLPGISGSTISLTGCFDGTDPAPEGAVQLDDEAGHHSNVLCFEGSAP